VTIDVAGWYVDNLTATPLVIPCKDGGTATFFGADAGSIFYVGQDGGTLQLPNDTGTLCPDGTATFAPLAATPFRQDTSSDPGLITRSGKFSASEPAANFYVGTFTFQSDDGNCSASVPEQWNETTAPAQLDGGTDAGITGLCPASGTNDAPCSQDTDCANAGCAFDLCVMSKCDEEAMIPATGALCTLSECVSPGDAGPCVGAYSGNNCKCKSSTGMPASTSPVPCQ
jgi:hypothetical protein